MNVALLEPLIKTITIPDFVIFSDKFGGNSVIRLGNKSIKVEAKITDSKISGFYLLKTQLPAPLDKLYLKKTKKPLAES